VQHGKSAFSAWFYSLLPYCLIALLPFDHNPIADSIVVSVLSHYNHLFDSFF